MASLRLADGTQWFSAWHRDGELLTKYSVFVTRAEPLHGLCEVMDLDFLQVATGLPLAGALRDFRTAAFDSLAALDAALGPHPQAHLLVEEVRRWLPGEAAAPRPLQS